MSSVNWTADQKKAIERKGGGIIVSAAAGSGKTAVLVERVVRLLTDEKAPVLPEKLLVVTFTKAAAAEMKHKIKAALKQNSAESEAARAAYLKIDRAIISTMDSFCVKLVRENFEQLGISPDFRMMDDSELTSVKKEAMNMLLEEFYAEGSSSFGAAFNAFVRDRDDSELDRGIDKLYSYSQGYPNPTAWLRSAEKLYYSDYASPLDSVWGKYIADYVQHCVKNCLRLLGKAVVAAQRDSLTADKYGPAVAADTERFAFVCEKLAAAETWDEYRSLLGGLLPLSKLKSIKTSEQTSEAAMIRNIREQIKKIIKSCLEYTASNSADFRADMDEARPIISALTEMTCRYSELTAAVKQRKNAYYFDDILHFSVDLLYDENGAQTPLCKKLSDSFDAVLIDEYQDTTKAQDALFSAVSDSGNNLFAVGDIKQSIYGFRLATPEIFAERCKNAVVSEENIFPSRIILGKNFRSRAEILSFVNFVFAQIMSEEAGGVNYDEKEMLYYGGAPSETSDSVDVLITEAEEDGFKQEARNIAAYIRKTVESGTMIHTKQGEREVRYGDFCILLRSAKGQSETLAEILYSFGIPSAYEKNTDYFAAPENRVLSALLNVSDNPLCDVDLLSVMNFPICGFTPDELAQIRVMSKGSLYACVKAAAQKTDTFLGKKCGKFLDFLSELRSDSLTMQTSDFVRRVIYDTDFSSMVAAMPGGAARLAGAEAFVSYAKSYEQSGAVGYSGFIRYLGNIRASEKTASVGCVHGDAENAVRIMSIHRSKGLEFPYVILADTTRRFNMSDTRQRLLTDMDFGASVKMQEREKLVKFEPLSYTATKLSIKNRMISEEIRVLYVALTRAAGKLVISAHINDREKFFGKLSSSLPSEGGGDRFAVLRCSDYFQMISLALFHHRDCAALRDAASAEFDIIPSDFGVNVIFCENAQPDCEAAESRRTLPVRKPFTPEMFGSIRDTIEYRYPFEQAVSVPAKITASGVGAGNKNYEKIIFPTPSFVPSSSVGGTARGTAYHRFLQHCDFRSAAENTAFETEKLVRAGVLKQNEAEMLDFGKLRAFFSSELCGEILGADKVFREFAFRVMLPANELFPVDSDEKILAQGVADLIYVKGDKAVIVDYKTDARADDEYLTERYKPQMTIYKKAIEEVLDIKITETKLYSISASREIII